METAELLQLSEKAIARLLNRRTLNGRDGESARRRAIPRWPFAGTVELWIPGTEVVEELILATCDNMGLGGMAIRCDEPLMPGTEYAVAIHHPEVSFQGRAVVCHCRNIDDGFYVGLEFIFDKK